ncbi:RIP metalloprotease RseP [Prolixibacter denitrificans]|uniref:Zinc metalloprotease n=1 Tax=Prolixibacter denitrificans TaxID=1541063 RepID=A0A2P8CI00_9BACT|nr:RIP metalloprotease RseP [Prolixibacter denitrificans]PSK84600.1 regulator of sigma E protease [Prolixibacter denitrificans]GET20767.1 zinc metalloprotease [Prolixibacter denitrificans]
MVVLVKAAQLILSLSILVVLHEFGHFIFAKLFKCRVEKFYLFFDPWFSLFKFKKGETEYGVGWLPLGGYVKISGMIDESMDKEQMKQPPQPWEFRSKPAWQRLLIMIGGVLFNLLFALFLYAMVLYTWGEQYLPTANVKYGIVTSDTGKEIGFQNGDKILNVDGKKVADFTKIVPTIVLEKASYVEVERDGKDVKVPITQEDIAKLLNNKNVMGVRIPYSLKVHGFMKKSPARDAGMDIGDKVVAINGQHFTYNDQFVQALKDAKGKTVDVTIDRDGATKTLPVTIGENGLLGVERTMMNLDSLFTFKTLTYGFWQSIPAGVTKGFNTVDNYLKQFKLLFQPETKAYESLGGFIAIGNIFPGIWDWRSFWNLTAFLSIILAVMNILPIPALDGGHVLFLLYEIISGRKPSDKFLEYAQIAGMVILFALLIFANGNDIIKLFKG